MLSRIETSSQAAGINKEILGTLNTKRSERYSTYNNITRLKGIHSSKLNLRDLTMQCSVISVFPFVSVVGPQRKNNEIVMSLSGQASMTWAVAGREGDSLL